MVDNNEHDGIKSLVLSTKTSHGNNFFYKIIPANNFFFFLALITTRKMNSCNKDFDLLLLDIGTTTP